MEKNVKDSLKKMKSLVKHMPKTINEAIDFNDDGVEMGINDNNYEDTREIEGDAADEVVSGVETEENVMNGASERAKQLIDDIRKKALRAMAELADTPEDENYIMLKKVWQMTDRKPEAEKKPEMN